MRALVVEELLGSYVADPVIGHEDDERVVQNALTRETVDDTAHGGIREPHRVQVGRLIGEQDGIARQVGRQRDILGPDGRAKRPGCAVSQFRRRLGRTATKLAPREHHLHEEGLARRAARPVGAVVHALVPDEVVVRLAQPPRSRPCAPRRFISVTDAGEVPRLPEPFRHGPHPRRQMDGLHATAAAVMVRADRRLVHARDERRAARGADGAGDERVGEPRALGREPVHVRRRHEPLAVAAEVRRHVVDDDPDDVGPRGNRVETGQHRRHRRNDECTDGPHLRPPQSHSARTPSVVSGSRTHAIVDRVSHRRLLVQMRSAAAPRAAPRPDAARCGPCRP